MFSTVGSMFHYKLVGIVQLFILRKSLKFNLIEY